ncbi:recombinase RarA, partial [Streptococcus anginosus]|nr:recombinase RarA [Streptococcus anginosus]
AGVIPKHLRDAHYSGAKKLGRGIAYKFPHDYPNHWVAQDYLPETLSDRQYYQACQTGKYEQALEQMRQMRERQK